MKPFKLRALIWALVLGCSLSAKADLTLPTLSGEQISLQALAGSDTRVLLSFWSVSCPPCYREMPALKQLHALMPQLNARLISVTMPYDRPDLVVETARSQKLNYPVALDIDGRISEAFGVTSTPLNVLLGADGKEIWRQRGEIDSAIVKKLLTEPGTDDDGLR